MTDDSRVEDPGGHAVRPDGEVITEKTLVEDILYRLAGMPEALRQTITDHQWSQIPLFVDEFNYAPAQLAGSQLQVPVQTSGGPEIITSVVASIPAGASGLIQLGNMVIPISAGVTVICPVQKILASGDTRGVTASITGPVSLWLTGQQLPTFGVLAK